MATKSALTTAINGYLTAIITQAKHRNSMLEIINTLFQTTVTQSDLSGTDKFQYSLFYKKVGNIVYVNGKIQNKYSISKASTTMVTIPNSELYAKTSQDTVSFGVSDLGSKLISFSTSGIYLIGTLSPNETIYINSHYQVND